MTIVAGTHSHGQGHATTYAQLVSDWLGVPFENIRLVQGDTDVVSFGAARTPRAARCLAARRSGRQPTASSKKRSRSASASRGSFAEGPRIPGGKFTRGRHRPLNRSPTWRRPLSPGRANDKFSIGLDASGSSDVPPTFPNGCHVCEVEIDPETGVVDVDRYAVVDDVGGVINPMICHGQIEGALAQGIGQALMEAWRSTANRPDAVGELHGLRDAARGGPATSLRVRLHRRSGKDQPARRERHRRSGLRRRAARGDERHPRRVASAGRLASRYARRPRAAFGKLYRTRKH